VGPEDRSFLSSRRQTVRDDPHPHKEGKTWRWVTDLGGSIGRGCGKVLERKLRGKIKEESYPRGQTKKFLLEPWLCWFWDDDRKHVFTEKGGRRKFLREGNVQKFRARQTLSPVKPILAPGFATNREGLTGG